MGNGAGRGTAPAPCPSRGGEARPEALEVWAADGWPEQDVLTRPRLQAPTDDGLTQYLPVARPRASEPAVAPTATRSGP